MATFPLPNIPPESYQAGNLSFGNQRQWQVHAACDLLAPAGTEVYAVEDGKVWYGPRQFFLSGPQHRVGKSTTFQWPKKEACPSSRLRSILLRSPPAASTAFNAVVSL